MLNWYCLSGKDYLQVGERQYKVREFIFRTSRNNVKIKEQGAGSWVKNV